ncbi:hypothetical protein [Rubrivirga sp.]|uniref:hypothetical protein n=1 Tax=Rubrivirga sp. TaxID=1885344 RepID=UPI003B51D792
MIKYASYVLAALLLLELALRLFGFANPPLYVEDRRYEYAFAPNQDIDRFGNRTLTDSLGRRSGPLRDGECVAAAFVGDSVINGGAPTDQAELATTLLDSLVGPRSRVVNVSAGSWGPDNAAAFLRAHGDGGARRIVAVFSSHDAEDEMTFDPVVGVRSDAPAVRPVSAIWEAWDRYARPRLSRLVRSERPDASSPPPSESEPEARAPAGLNPGWTDLVAYARDRDVPLTVYLHAETGEVEAGEYNEGGQRVLRLLDSLGVQVVRDLPTIRPDEYRDYIHLNARGQAAMAERLSPLVSGC